MVSSLALHVARDRRWSSCGSRASIALGGAALATLLACNVDTTGTPPSLVPHCADLEGNLTCTSEYPSRPYCNGCVPASENQGCVSSPPPAMCSPENTTDPETGTPDESSTGSSSGTTEADTSTSATAPDTSVGDSSTTVAPYECREEGALDEDCEALDPATPYCIDAGCVGCVDAGGDAYCTSIDPMQPSCDARSGQCQSCTMGGDSFCGGDTPVCTDDGACRACIEHAECATACHVAPTDPLSGECFAADQVVWVDASATCPGMATEDEPACSLAQAIALVPPAEAWTLFVEGGANYAEHVLIEGKTVAIRGTGNVQITGDGVTDAATVTVVDAIGYLDAVRVRNNTLSHGTHCSDSTLWLDDSQVRNNIEYGMFSDGPCDLTLRRSSVLRNVGGGVRQLGGVLVLDNASVVSNGDASSGPGVNLQFAELRAVYSTIGDNDGVGADSIQCLDATGSVRNSIVAGAAINSIELDCFVLELATNAIDTPSFVEAGSVAIGPYDASWFINPAEGDMRLADPLVTLFFQIALWVEGDTPLDGDGTPRPMDGVLGYAGVDQP